MAKVTVPAKLYEEYKNEQSCFGKMYKKSAPDCQAGTCPDWKVCKSVQEAEEVVEEAVSSPDVVEVPKENLSRGQWVEFILEAGQEKGVEFEKVELKSRDKLYFEDTQIFTITNKTIRVFATLTGFDIPEDAWEEAYSGFLVSLDDNKYIETILNEVLERLLTNQTLDVAEKSEKDDGPNELPLEEGTDTETPSEDSVSETPDPSNQSDSSEFTGITSKNLERGLSIFAGSDGILKIEMYVHKDEVSKELLMKKVNHFFDFLVEEE